MVIALIIIAVIAFFFLLNQLKARQKQIRLKAAIHENWGEPTWGDRNFRLIGLYKDICQPDEMLSDATANDLDLESLFVFIDRTYSKPGQQYLYRKLFNREVTIPNLNQLDARVEALPPQEQAEEIAVRLAALGGNDAYYLPQLFKDNKQHLFSAAASFYIKISGLLIIALIPLLIITHHQVFFLLLLGMCITNLLVHYATKNKIYQFTHSLPQLIKLYKLSQWLNKQPSMKADAGVTNAITCVGKLKRSLNFVNLENSAGGDPTDVSFFLLELLNIFFLLQPLMFLISIEKANRYNKEIRQVYEYVGECDLLLSIRNLRDGLSTFSKPQFADSDQLRATNIYHPLVEHCVPNTMNTIASKGVLVTGSNMSGKTTFIRALALNTLMAQTLFTVCAEAYEAPLLKIHTSIRLSDDVEEHKSYFQAEALSVLDIIKQCDASNIKSLVIIDEIFRGTNTIERVAAAKAVLAYLTAKQNFVFVSTHDLELAELLGDDYAVYSFEENISADRRLVFDYRIKPGLLKNKNGIAVLQSLGYPQSVISDAATVSEVLRQKYQL